MIIYAILKKKICDLPFKKISSETDYNALDSHLWKHLGSEFMIKSNINNWIACREGSGSLIKYRAGSISCRIVNNLTHKCGNVVPNQIEVGHL